MAKRTNARIAGPEIGRGVAGAAVVHEVLERRVVRRIDDGRLGGWAVESLGLALARLRDQGGKFNRVSSLSEEDLQIDLALGRLARGYYMPALTSPSRGTVLLESPTGFSTSDQEE